MRYPLRPLMLLMTFILAGTAARAHAADAPSVTGALTAPPLVESAPSASTVQPPSSQQEAGMGQGHLTGKRWGGAFLVEGLAGGAGAFLGGTGAAVLFYTLLGPPLGCSFFSGSSACSVITAVAGATGASLVSSLGVTLVGDLLGGDGQYLAALGGAAVGMALAMGILAVSLPFAPLAPLLTFGLPTIGAVVGYELSVGRGGAAPAQPLASRSRTRLVPSATILPGGGMALLAGVF